MTLPPPTEELEQMRFVQWLETQGHKYTAIPNSTFTKSWKQKLKNKNTGLRAGFPDMVVIAKNTFMCIELKRTVGGQLSEHQRGWIEALKKSGTPVGICKGADEAIVFVKKTAGLP